MIPDEDLLLGSGELQDDSPFKNFKKKKLRKIKRKTVEEVQREVEIQFMVQGKHLE